MSQMTDTGIVHKYSWLSVLTDEREGKALLQVGASHILVSAPRQTPII